MNVYSNFPAFHWSLLSWLGLTPRETIFTLILTQRNPEVLQILPDSDSVCVFSVIPCFWERMASEGTARLPPTSLQPRAEPRPPWGLCAGLRGPHGGGRFPTRGEPGEDRAPSFLQRAQGVELTPLPLHLKALTWGSRAGGEARESQSSHPGLCGSAVSVSPRVGGSQV